MKQEMYEALKEVRNVCKEYKACGACPFVTGPDDEGYDGYHDIECIFETAPENWNLELLEEEEEEEEEEEK